MISLCAVAVITPQARCWIIVFSKSHDSLLRNASSPSSTAANASSAPASGLPSYDTLTFAIALPRTTYCGLSVVTATCSSCALMPTFNAATPGLNPGFDRSTIAVGAWDLRPSYQKLRTQFIGSVQP